jgi:Cu/Ag efflux pump CusA
MVAMAAGMVPTALSLGGDGSSRAPIGIAVVGGLVESTSLTLLPVPATFSVAQDFGKWPASKLRPLVREAWRAGTEAVLAE